MGITFLRKETTVQLRHYVKVAQEAVHHAKLDLQHAEEDLAALQSDLDFLLKEEGDSSDDQ